MKYGRKDVTLTIFVPEDCKKNCKFCTTKEEYKDVQIEKIIKNIDIFVKHNKNINNVVFTGGEPMYSIDFMSEVIDKMKNNKTIQKFYINTEFVSDEEYRNKFKKFIIKYRKYIAGISISRHHSINDYDFEEFVDMSEYVNIRINKIDFDDKSTLAYLNKYSNVDFQINIRADYRYVNKANLLYIPKWIKKLKDEGVDTAPLIRNDMTMSTRYIDYHNATYHRSLTQAENNNIINDIVFKPNGNIIFDWDINTVKIDKFINTISKK